jgi:AcrR family transcriptional regulator
MSPRRSAIDSAATRQSIIDHAVQMGSSQGLEGVTIGLLAEDLGMSKAGVLGHFGTKQALQLATLDRVATIFTEAIIEPGLAQPRGLLRLRAWCEAWIDYLETSVFPGGCFVTAASCEFDGRPGPVRDRVGALMATWLKTLEREIDIARDTGELSSSINSSRLAMELNGLAMAANQSFQLFGNKKGLALMRSALSDRLA